MRRCLTAPRAAPKSDTREYSSLPIDGAPLGPGCRHPTHLLEGSRTVAPHSSADWRTHKVYGCLGWKSLSIPARKIHHSK